MSINPMLWVILVAALTIRGICENRIAQITQMSRLILQANPACKVIGAQPASDYYNGQTCGNIGCVPVVLCWVASKIFSSLPI